MNSFLLRRLLPFFVFTILVEFSELTFMLVSERAIVDLSFLPLIKTYGVLLLTSTVSFLYLMIPYVLYLTFLPASKVNSRFDKAITTTAYGIYIYLIMFEEIVSMIFWEEYASSFNFIAVDYLIYTQQVFTHILQSFPIVWYLLALIIFTLVTVFTTRNFLFNKIPSSNFGKRIFFTSIYLTFCALTFVNISVSNLKIEKNRVNNELAKEGIYSLFSAFWNNELSYDEFYLTRSLQQSLQVLQKNLGGKDVSFLHPDKSIVREIDIAEKEKKHNVIVVLMESMSAKFMEENRPSDTVSITPNLTKLSQEGLYFANTYATGTQSVRGIEAITLSIPPIPGLSVIRRENKKSLYNISTIFKTKGYENKWVYGGFGYFDNIDGFLGKNGFEIIDRSHWQGEDVDFANFLGASDEDTFNKLLKEADASFANEHPFFLMTMTLSNHHPYSYPDGKIDLPARTSKRLGGVKYSDYAIGQFIAQAKEKPWFDNTIFVFVGNRTAGSDRVENIKPENFHVPMIFYAPKIFQPQRITKNVSQIDAMPTLLGLMKFEYESRFYGQDVLEKNYVPRFFISNEQKLGYIKNEVEIMLQPVREFSVQPKHSPLQDSYLDEAIAYYQDAADWRENLKESQ